MQAQPEPLVSVYDAPVSNVTQKRDVSWPELAGLLTADPIFLDTNSAEEKAKKGAYFVRGRCNGKRDDEHLQTCSLVIIDIDKPIDGHHLPTPEEIHQTLADVQHAVHNTATPGRSRIVLPVKTYNKEKTKSVQWAAYRFCRFRGLNFAFAGEVKTKSQPWFLPQTTDIFDHQVYAKIEGELFDCGLVKVESEPIKPEASKIEAKPGHNHLAAFIAALQTGTIHEAAKVYAGWSRRTTNLTCNQIFDVVTVLIDLHCSDPAKVNRWHHGEREKLEEWFNDQDFAGVAGAKPDSKIDGSETVENILEDFEVKRSYVESLGKEEFLYPNLIIQGHILVIVAMSGGGKTTFLF
ncbi:MAG TPA: hypothetical protein EYP19_16250, partial [Desulfobacterales bacterium]|nr:hypothetical protein [Desulfobacterales bacterium]